MTSQDNTPATESRFWKWYASSSYDWFMLGVLVGVGLFAMMVWVLGWLA